MGGCKSQNITHADSLDFVSRENEFYFVTYGKINIFKNHSATSDQHVGDIFMILMPKNGVTEIFVSKISYLVANHCH